MPILWVRSVGLRQINRLDIHAANLDIGNEHGARRRVAPKRGKRVVPCRVRDPPLRLQSKSMHTAALS